MITPLHELAAPRIAERTHIAWGWLAKNPHPEAIQMLSDRIDELVASPNTHMLARSLFGDMADNENPKVANIFERHIDFLDRNNVWQDNNITSCRAEWLIGFLARHQDKPFVWRNLLGWPLAEQLVGTQRRDDLLRPNGLVNWAWDEYSKNSSPTAIDILSRPENFNLINWVNLSENPGAMELLLRYPENISWMGLSRNTNPQAIAYLEQNIRNPEINWELLVQNSGAVQLIERHIHMVNTPRLWRALCSNPSDAAIQLIDQHRDRLDDQCWVSLATNSIPTAVTHILEKHLALLDKFKAHCIGKKFFMLDFEYSDNDNIWNNIWRNPDIFPPEHPVLK